VTAAAADVAFGDLVLMAVYWVLTSSATATFSETLNNGTSAVHAGDTGGSASITHYSVSYGIVPVAKTALPLGVADWGYDVAGSNRVGSGSAASVVLAASPGKAYTAAMVSVKVVQTAATSTDLQATLKDGTNIIYQEDLDNPATIGSGDGFRLTGIALKGAAGNSMTLAISAGVAGMAQSVNIGAYLR